MHELSVAQALVEQLTALAADHGRAPVARVVLGIGPLSGVEATLLRNAYPVAAAGSVAEGAELVIETGGVRVRCSACGAETDALPNRLVCGDCGDLRTTLTEGDELTLRTVEFESR